MSPDLQHAAAETELELGAHLVTQRAGYSHHGIYVGDGRVIHYSGLCTSLHRGPVEEVSLQRFAAGHQVVVACDAQARYAGIEAVARARSRLGENQYRLLTNNCEHFCTWCVCGKARSEQVRACVAHPSVAARAVMGMCRALMAARRQHAQRAVWALQAA
ncbi:hypothetical protein FAZ69_27100 [Trinickia terrae]|uniref:LRAT domain-containing protein n=1 Tax=Trinickia terrae TaxID=2571161 RepID=A0A4U1HS35_9BURK|nr:lecithin retinol acyltransferase family protein [Trinickia terrae]TKC81636.1 hypothetical protein FAZ69_27100 [Trinickia terrae]